MTNAEEALIAAAIEWYYAEKERDDWDDAIAEGAVGVGGHENWDKAKREQDKREKRLTAAEDALRYAAVMVKREREKDETTRSEK